MKWHPIKTAPKDQLILLSCDEHPEYPPYVCLGRWCDIPHTNQIHSLLRGDGHFAEDIKSIEDLNRSAQESAHWHDGYPGVMQGGNAHESWYSWEYRGGILFHPTHWMPLPKGAVKRRRR